MLRDTSTPIVTLHDLLDHDIRKFTSAELQLSNSLTEWIYKSNSLPLKTVLQRYLSFVNTHIRDLQVAADEEKVTSMELKNRIMQALIEETNEKLGSCSDPEVKDACLLASVQTINHLKISLYGTAAAFARALGIESTATIFHDAEMNEKQIDERLTKLAEQEVNVRAKAPIVIEMK